MWYIEGEDGKREGRHKRASVQLHKAFGEASSNLIRTIEQDMSS